MKRIFPDFKKPLIIVTALLSLLLGSIFLLRVSKRSGATPGVPTLSYSVDPATLQAGQNFDLVLKVNPNGATFFAFELYTNFDPTKVEFQNMNNLNLNITSSHSLINYSIDTASNLITIIGTKTGNGFAGNSDMELARVKMKTKTGAAGDINFTWATSTKLGNNLNKELLNGIFTIGGGSGQPTSTPAPSGPDLHIDIPSMAAAGSSATAQKGENVDVEVLLKSDNNQVKSVDFILPYDDSRLTFQNTADLSSNIEINPNSGFNTQFVLKNVDINAKKVTFALVAPVVNQVPSPISSPNDILLATIKFKVRTDAPDGLVALLPDTTSTIYNLQTQNILACTGGFRFTVGVAVPTDTPIPGFPTDTPSQPFPTNTPYIPYPTSPPNLTGVPGGVAMALDLKLRFQGIVIKPNRLSTIPVQITVRTNSPAQPAAQSISVNLTADNSGIWSGQAYFPSLIEAPDYKILIKGPVHLQKRICDLGAGETEPGKYSCISGNIQLLAGTNSLNFNGINLIAGDLPQQDGVANAYDVALVRNNLGSTDPNILIIADVNFDGIVDTQDYSLVIGALAIRTDDEL